MKDAENEVQTITDEFSAKIDSHFEIKEKDIMTV
jgi:ribosome recycling factor